MISIGSALARQILPPFKFIDSLGKDIIAWGDEKGLEMIGSIPVIGKLAYWHIGRGTKKREDLWNRRLKKEKARLNKIKEKGEASKDKFKFKQTHLKELNRLIKLNNLQHNLNLYRQSINNLKSREEGRDTKAKINRLEKKRTELIKKFLKS